MVYKISTTCLVALLLITNVAAETDLNYKSDELLIRFAPKTDGSLMTRSEKQTLLSTLNSGTVKHEYKIVPGLSLVKLPDGLSVKDAISLLKTRKDILYVEPNYKLTLFSVFPNDSRFDELWGMHNTGQTGGTPDADIDAPQAWDISTDSNIIVAVIDSGVDYNHPDLKANMWHNPGEIPGNGIDDDNNGYIGDILSI
jgi:subtilisin family serine protease